MFKKIFKNLINKKEDSKKESRDLLCPKCNDILLRRNGELKCTGVAFKTCDFEIKESCNGIHIDEKVLNEFREAQLFKYIQSAIDGNKDVSTKSTTNVQEATNTQSINKVQEADIVQKTNKVEETTKAQETNTVLETTKAQETVVNNSTSSNTLTSTTKQDNNNDSNQNQDKFFTNGNALKHPCSCGSKVFRYGNLARCSNTNCGFQIDTFYQGKNFTNHELSQLLGRRISIPMAFINSDSGEKFRGRVFIDFDNQKNFLPKYNFVSALKQIDNRYVDNLFAPDTEYYTARPLIELIEFSKSKDKSRKKTVPNNPATKTNKSSNKATTAKAKENKEMSDDASYLEYKKANSELSKNLNSTIGNNLTNEERRKFNDDNDIPF